MNELLLKSWKVLALRGAISLVFRYETHTDGVLRALESLRGNAP